MAKVSITADQLIELAEVSIDGGTQDAWISVAIDWIKAADAEISRLLEKLEKEVS